MELEIYVDYMEGMGVESADRMRKSLDEFAKFDEFDLLQKKFGKIVRDAKTKFKESNVDR
jgi:hypothetical protein